MTSDLDLLLQSANRQPIADLARAAGRVGLHDERSRFAQALVRRVDAAPHPELSPAEHTLIGEAWKGEIEPRHAARLTLAALTDDPLLPAWCAELTADLARRIEGWLSLLRGPILATAHAQDGSEIEQLTWIGDLEAALAGCDPDADHGQRADEAYAKALELARRKLPPTSPIRLGLVLNYVVCTYEILKNQERAQELAKEAFEEAISGLDQLDAESEAVASEQLKRLWDLLQAWGAR
jgi:14-3-3 protein epsilon